jgi:phosphatidylglycerophosphate synthase
LTLVRVLAVPVVIVLFLADFHGHDYWATAVFIVAMTTDWFDRRLKTWSQATAAAVGGLAAAGAWSKDVAWWALLIAVALTWLSGLDYARLAAGLLSGRTASP